MRLVHYGAKPLGKIRDTKQGRREELFFKPRGLWVSDDACEHNWRWWCEAEDFRVDQLACAQEVTLMPGANVLFLRSVQDIDAFDAEYVVPGTGFARSYPDWLRVAKNHDGIIITPYQWERRLCDKAQWYYSWDCASGCIWNKRAIAAISDPYPVDHGTMKQSAISASTP